MRGRTRGMALAAVTSIALVATACGGGGRGQSRVRASPLARPVGRSLSGAVRRRIH